MFCVKNVGGQALLVGGMATWLTAISTGNNWLIKDYVFVLAVMAAVLVGGLRKEKYELLGMSKRMQQARDLENIDFIHGDPVQLKRNKVTCILFFGTWCRKSREALKVLSNLHQTIPTEAVQFIGLTQESREELAMYEIRGRSSNNFRELKEFPFAIGIETGSISKEYLVRCNLFTVPQLFIVGKEKSILWFGNPCGKTVESFSGAAWPTPRNFSFSGCGFLLSYHLGVAQGLQDAGYIQASSKFAGASGGAIAALSLAANVNMSDVHEETKVVARLCRSQGTIWRLEERMRAIFHTKFSDLPVKKLAQRLTIATERIWPARALVLTDDFHSTDDLCDALIASCYIPWYLARRGTSMFRGEYHVDGGIRTLVPEVPGYVKVCAFPAHLFYRNDYDISPSIDPTFPYAILSLVRFAIVAPQVEVLDQLFELGQRSAYLWVDKQVSVTGTK